MSEKLKKPRLRMSPFCGGPGIYREQRSIGAEFGFWTAGCAEGHAESPDMDTPEEAASWWNRRPRKRRT